ncbi:MAG: hypothetical protein P4N59_32175 [Negativicutes bacterium]|nr:hypothetical protein [Negativicutes bacterium]
MNSKVSIMVIIFSLVLMSFAVSASASAVVPDGFVGIPWGANREQVIKTMNERGFTTQGTTSWGGMAPSTLVFRGAFDGVPCQLQFDLLNNALYAGHATQLGLFSPPGHLEGLYKRMVSQIGTKYGPPQSDKMNEYKEDNGKIYGRGWMASWELIDNDSLDKFGIWVDLDIPGAMYYSNAPDPNKPEPSVTITYTAISLQDRLKKKEF